MPALAAGYAVVQRRQQRRLRAVAFGLMPCAKSPGRQVPRHAPPVLLLLAVVALLLAAARPAMDFTSLVRRSTVVLAIDVSMSMSATDVAPSRLAAAQAAATAFIDALPRDVRVGIVAFSGYADIVQVPTRNREYLREAVRQLHLDYNTAIGSGMMAALIALFPGKGIADNYDIFGRSGWRDGGLEVAPPKAIKIANTLPAQANPGSLRSAAIILLTDGKNTSGLDPRIAARFAAERGVRIFTVGFGSAAGTLTSGDGEVIEARFDDETLREVAHITRGAYSHAESMEGLTDVYRRLTPEVILERNRETEMTAAFVGAAIVLLLLSAASSLLWYGRAA